MSGGKGEIPLLRDTEYYPKKKLIVKIIKFLFGFIPLSYDKTMV